MGYQPKIHFRNNNTGEERRLSLKYEKDAPGDCIDATMEYLDNISDIYQRAGMLVSILPQYNGSHSPEQISESNLTGLISKYLEYFKIKATKTGFEEQSIAPPKEVMNAIYTAKHWPKVPHLRTITSHPVVARNGSIRSKPGYDPETQVFSTHKGDLQVKPFTQEQAEHARLQLHELVDEFPFMDIGADVWLGSILTPLVRPWCGPSPMFIVTSSTPAAGKGRLIDISSIISCGSDGIESTTLPPNEEEFGKCHTSWALSCPEIIYFDNVRSGTAIGFAVLDMALTQDRVSGRLLGQSKFAKTELSATWMASGNNISTKGDTSRRVLICRIEPMIEHPETREFRIPDILGHTRKHRKHYLSLACGIISGWLSSKGPSPLPILGSFEEWSHAVRGAILWAGGEDISEALASRVFDGDDSSSVHRSLLEIWHRHIEKPITAKELLEECQNVTGLVNSKIPLADIIAEFCPGRNQRFGTVNQLSYRLRSIENRVRNVKNYMGAPVKMAITRASSEQPIKWIIDIL